MFKVDDLSFPMKTCSLNPDAPAFFPSRNALLLVSAVEYSPSFLHYDPNCYLAPRFSYPCLPPPHAPVTAVSPLSSSFPAVAQEATHKGSGTCKSRNRGHRGRAKPRRICTVDKKVFARNFDHHHHHHHRGEKRPLIPLKYDGNETTVMIKNIPNRYTREMLKDFLDEHCMIMNRECSSADEEPASFSAFDFLYLPIDFYTKSNRGYAFVNFSNPRAARRFFDECHDKHWDYFHSTKIREIYCAKLQGMEQLVKQFETMEFPCVEYQPLCFEPARDGSNQLVKETVIGRFTGPDQT